MRTSHGQVFKPIELTAEQYETGLERPHIVPRGRLIALRKQGWPVRKIGTEVGLSVGAVHKIIRVAGLPRRGGGRRR